MDNNNADDWEEQMLEDIVKMFSNGYANRYRNSQEYVISGT